MQQQAKAEQESFMDPLLECLVILTKLNERPLSAEALKAGLPLVQNRLIPQLFVRAAARAGMAARIVQRPLKKISQLVLPAVLILKDNRACILNKVIDADTYEIILPESNGGISKISFEDLNESYSGFVIFTKPVYKFDKRADEYNIATKKSWFWGTLWNYKNIYGQVVLAALLINLFALASPLFIMNVYDRVVPNFAVETLWVLATGVAIVFGFDFLLRTLRGYLIDVAGKKADTVLASVLFHQAMGVKMAAKPASSGAFASRLREFESLRDFFTSATVTTLVDLPFIFIFVAIIWMIGGIIAIVPVIAIPIVFCASYFLEIPVRRAVEKAMFGATQKHAILVESINSLETIKSLSAEGVMQRKWEQYVASTAQAGLTSRFFSTIAVNLTAYVSQMVTVVIVICGVYLIATNKLSMGGLIACVILNGRAIAPLAQLAGIITRYNQSKIALRGLNEVMKLPVEREAEKRFLHRPLFQESIIFKNVSFQYPDQEAAALKEINLMIKMGEKVAILGPMGSGKSTIQKLILNLYEATEGAVFIDGIDINQLDPADIRRNIGYVSQDFSLLYGSVHSNIALSAPWVHDQAVLQAAKLANVDSFVAKHPAGYAMPIGEQGAGLSGGQRQSIAIARAILSNPKVLLLDEPTSAIDTDSEQVIIRNLKQFYESKTVIVATHKMSMLQIVDRIIILGDGKIVADGPKDKILASMPQINLAGR
ncbi:MAG: type I secretion system permease/ATPase [Gammaproteobacteria bacterium]|nr:type I secretion system permease/ATPase [Gammaproteobacteria bacterium]